MNISSIVSSKEWNKLTQEEKVGRYKEFLSHLKDVENNIPQVPIDLSFLTSLAILYKTPVPIYTNGKLYFGDYK